MKKFFVFFVMFALMFSLAYAESNSGNNSDDNSTGNPGDDDLECTVDSDCDSDEVCLSGECEDAEDNDNSTGNSSDDDLECVTDLDCSNDNVCLSGECEDVEDNTNSSDDSPSESDDDDVECTINSDCDSDEVCLNNECEDVEDDSDDNSTRNGTRWVKECVDDSVLRDATELMSKMRRAQASGNEAKVLELKKDIEELNAKIRVKASECNRLRNMNQGYFVSEAVKYKNGSASGIVDYYKLKLAEISSETNETIRLQMLKDLRDNIDIEIRNIMENSNKIHSDDMKEFVKKIEVRKDKILADDVEVDSENKSILMVIDGKEIEIKVLNHQVMISVDGVEVDASTITIENNTLYYNGTLIKVLPSEALFRDRIWAKEIELEREGSKLVYKVKYDENRKILGLFKAKAHREAHIDSENGKELEDKGPWWTFLATTVKNENVTNSTN